MNDEVRKRLAEFRATLTEEEAERERLNEASPEEAQAVVKELLQWWNDLYSGPLRYTNIYTLVRDIKDLWASYVELGERLDQIKEMAR